MERPSDQIHPKLNEVLLNLDRRRGEAFFDTQVQKFINTKSLERASPFVENPLAPGLLFRKTETMSRIEREEAEPWENIVDFLTRGHQELTKGELAKQIGLSRPRFWIMLKRLAFPVLTRAETLEAARKAQQQAKWQRMQEDLGNDPVSTMREVFEERKMSTAAVVKKLRIKRSPETLRTWARQQGIRPDGNPPVKVVNLSPFKEYPEYVPSLRPREQQAVLLAMLQPGVPLRVIGMQMGGVGKAAVSRLIIQAKKRLTTAEATRT